MYVHVFLRRHLQEQDVTVSPEESRSEVERIHRECVS